MTIKTKLTVFISLSNRTDFLSQARNAVNQLAADTFLISDQGRSSAFNTGPTGQTMAQFKLFTGQDENQK